MTQRFRKVVWNSEDPITVNKLATMAANDELVFEKFFTGQYTAYGKSKPDGSSRLKMEVGTRTVSGMGDDYLLRVNFVQKFSSECQPVVVATLSTPNRFNTFITIEGDGKKNPDSKSCIIRLSYQANLTAQQRETFKYGTIHYMAVGY